MMKRGHGKRYIGTERIVYETLAVSVKRREVVTGFARVVVTTADCNGGGDVGVPQEDPLPVMKIVFPSLGRGR